MELVLNALLVSSNAIVQNDARTIVMTMHVVSPLVIVPVVVRLDTSVTCVWLSVANSVLTMIVFGKLESAHEVVLMDIRWTTPVVF